MQPAASSLSDSCGLCRSSLLPCALGACTAGSAVVRACADAVVCARRLTEHPYNAAQAEHKGVGIALSMKFPVKVLAHPWQLVHHHILSPEPASVVQAPVLGPQMEAALKRVLADPGYKQRAERISELMQAQRWSPAEKAANVVESVGWSKGSTHMKMELQSWLVTNMIDTAAVLLSAGGLLLGAVGWAVYAAVRAAWRRLKRSRKGAKQQ